jgi:methylated-DNA-[protein]-cysteine S-methyltransferase
VQQPAKPGDRHETHRRTHDSPLGPIAIAATDVGVVRCALGPPDPVRDQLAVEEVGNTNSVPARRCLKLVREEFDAYFVGALRAFTVAVDLRLATPFHRFVFAALGDIEYGRTTTYGQLAASLGLPGPGARMVGSALAHNPLLIVVPCHRVIGANGKLTGYSGGVDAKRQLIDLETGVDPQSAVDLQSAVDPQSAVDLPAEDLMAS